MSDETTTPAPATKAQPKIKPLSLVEFGPFSILVFDRSFPPENVPEGMTVSVKHEVFLSIRRASRGAEDDPGSIPLTDVPSLVMLLEEISRTGMAVKPLTEQLPLPVVEPPPA